MKKLSVIWCSILLAATFTITSCANTNESTVLSPKEFKTALASEKNALVLDVRTAEEFGNGHIDNAVNVDWNQGPESFTMQLANVPKETPIYVYCQGGSRSATALIKLKELGYTNIKELDGGMVAWNSEFGAAPSAKAKPTGMSMDDFNKIIKTDKAVLVDFNAEWCPPCQKMKPFLHEIQKEMKDDVEVLFIDVDKNPDIANMFKINGLPTLMIYKDGVKQWTQEGYMDKVSLVEKINLHNK